MGVALLIPTLLDLHVIPFNSNIRNATPSTPYAASPSRTTPHRHPHLLHNLSPQSPLLPRSASPLRIPRKRALRKTIRRKLHRTLTHPPTAAFRTRSRRGQDSPRSREGWYTTHQK